MGRLGNERRWVEFGPYCADLRTRELSKYDVRVKLQPRPFEILAMLLVRQGDVVTREEIREQLWPQGTFVDFDSNISSAVRKLRDTLCDSAADPRYIETVGRVGYRFIGQAEFTRAEEEQVAKAEQVMVPLAAGSRPQEPLVPAHSSASVSQGEKGVESQTAVAVAPVVVATIEGHRYTRWPHWKRLVLASVVVVGIVIAVVAGVSRRWLTSVTAAGSVTASPARATAEAAAEYSTGRELWSRRGEGNLKAAIEHYRLAIEKQPDYGLAYSGLADAYILLPFYSRVTPAEVYPKAKAAALRAVELAPRSAEAHTSLAYVKLYSEWDFRGVEEEFRIALQQNPNYPTALQWHAEYLSLIGRYDDAIREITRAISLMPNSAVMHHNAGQIYQAARRYDEAIAEYSSALQLDPTFSSSGVFMALAYMHRGMPDKAMDLQMEAAVATGDPTRIAVLQRLTDSYRANGLEGYLRELVVVEMEDNPDRDAYRIAEDYAQLGQKDLAFQYLDRAYQLHFSDLLSMNADPELDSLRSDPRFLSLRRRVGLPTQSLELF
jgi:DNA-binding winged helix-turn-helix (wHTH) protein/tetratricopeptide (TPR) repeat protein